MAEIFISFRRDDSLPPERQVRVGMQRQRPVDNLFGLRHDIAHQFRTGGNVMDQRLALPGCPDAAIHIAVRQYIFTRTGAGPNKESVGTMKLYVNDQVVAEGPMKTQPAKFTLSGDGLCVGYDSGDAVSAEYKTPGTFHGGTIQLVGVTVEKASYEALEMEAQRALMHE